MWIKIPEMYLETHIFNLFLISYWVISMYYLELTDFPWHVKARQKNYCNNFKIILLLCILFHNYQVICMCWELQPCTMEEQQSHLTCQPCLQPLRCFHKKTFWLLIIQTSNKSKSKYILHTVNICNWYLR